MRTSTRPFATVSRGVHTSVRAVGGFVTLGHDALCSANAEVRCDICSVQLSRAESDAPPYAVRGEALYAWTRGDEHRREEPPLCADCAAAIGISALTRWAMEEDDG